MDGTGMATRKIAVDPITLEVAWTRLRSAVDEAAKVIVRTSFSTLSNEANDFSCVLTDAEGRSIAQNTSSIPSFIGTLPATVRHFIAKFGKGGLKKGDILVTNNPWHGTGHLNDICLAKPIFLGNALVAFASTTSHVPDIGGRVISVGSTELFEEGFHIPAIHLMKQGRVDQTLLSLLMENVRTPRQTEGDIFAQVSALALMETRVLGVMRDHGLKTLARLADALFGRAEQAMRNALKKIPAGTYHYETFTDGFDAPFRFRIALTVSNGRLHADYSGTTEQQPLAINCVLAYTYAMTAYAVKAALLPNLPNNDGMFRPITVTAPEGCLLNPRFPAAVGARHSTGHYVPILIFGALEKVIPEKLMAAPGSPLWMVTLSGMRENQKPFANVLFYNGGMGATAHKDGENALSWPSNISCTPSEVTEAETPMTVHLKGLWPRSGGRGKFRGGLGQEIILESRSVKPIRAMILAERRKVGAPGLCGGDPGQPGDVLLNGQSLIDQKGDIQLKAGDLLMLRTPGGGGYGNPLDRDPHLTAKDEEMGYA
jgi:N-methylhydantoinase B